MQITSPKLFVGLFGFAALLSPSAIWADGVTEYLPGESIHAIVYDSKRHLTWFGSAEGRLISFDGFAFKYYTASAPEIDKPLIIEALALDHNADPYLWIGTRNLGLVRFLPEKNSWKVYNTSNGMNDVQVQSLEIDHIGRLWVGTNSGVGRLDSTVWYRYTVTHHARWTGAKWDTIETYLNTDKRLAGNRVNDIGVDAAGNIFFGTDGGGSWLNSRLQWQAPLDLLVGKKVSSICVDATGIWFGTNEGSQGGVYKLSADHSTWELRPEQTPAYARSTVNAIISDANNNLWFGLNSDAVKLDPAKMIWRRRTGSILDGRTVTSMAATEDGVIWFGFPNRRGAIKCMSNWVKFSFTTGHTQGNRINVIVRDQHDQIWVGNNLGVARDSSDFWKSYIYFLPLFDIRNEMTTIAVAEDSTLWLGSFGGGILHIRPDSSIIERFGASPGKLISNSVRTLAIDKNIIWIGTEDGLTRYDRLNQTWNSFTTAQGLPSNRVQALFVDSGHVLWLGTPLGACQIDTALRLTCLTTLEAKNALGVGGVNSISLDTTKNRIWLGTAGNGAAYYENGAWGRLTTSDGLVDNNVGHPICAPAP
jgi:ligand-binding sensor domain-containing protein